MNTAKLNQILSVIVLFLVAASAFAYRDSVTRAERFERGQKFLQNLNPDEVAQISVQKGDDEVVLKRQDDRFIVTSANGYPAANESVNRFIRDVLDLGLEKRVGSGDGLQKELGFQDGGEGDAGEEGGEVIEVAFLNDSEKDMVRFAVSEGGESSGDASGSYVMRKDGDDQGIYLTSSRVYLRTQADDFLKKDIVDVKNEDVIRVVSQNWEVNDEEGTARLAGLPAGKKESSKVDQAKSVLSSLRFSKHYLANAPEVMGLLWDTTVQVHLNDDSFYVVSLAQSGEKHYLRITADHQAQQLSIARDADDDEVKETAETLKRLSEIDEFNSFHQAWVYEVTEWTAKKFRVPRDEMIEDS